MKHIISLSVLFAFVLSPVFANAQTNEEIATQINALLKQIEQLKAQLTQSTPSVNSSKPTEIINSGSCYKFNNYLSYGSRDSKTSGEVSKLQNFLKEEGYFSGDVTGYFGTLTRNALRRWQYANGVVSSDSTSSVGYGSVGPQTRKKIGERCVSIVPVKNTPIITSPNGGENWKIGDTKTISWIGVTNKCPIGASCVQVMPSYDIKIVPFTVCPSGMVCSTFAVLPRLIASSISSNNYNWKVGILETDNYNTGISVLKSGSYKMMVCNSGTNICDESDREFKITETDLNAPVISEISAPTSIGVGKEGT